MPDVNRSGRFRRFPGPAGDVSDTRYARPDDTGDTPPGDEDPVDYRSVEREVWQAELRRILAGGAP